MSKVSSVNSFDQFKADIIKAAIKDGLTESQAQWLFKQPDALALTQVGYNMHNKPQKVYVAIMMGCATGWINFNMRRELADQMAHPK